jgi:hypothetical protein
VAGARWTIEEAFQASKTLTGLDEHQVRRWTTWRRWTLIAMLAHALLAALAATDRAPHALATELIPRTNEIARLLNRLLLEPAHRLLDPRIWSDCRRRHQHRARTCHYRRRPET